jgi:hypothetical protein
LLEWLVVHAVSTAAHPLVHHDILRKGVIGDGVILIDEGLHVFVLVDVSVDRGLGDFIADRVLDVCVARQDSEGHATYTVG